MTKNIEICKAEEVGAQVLDILGTTAERQAVAAINAAFGLAIPLPAAEPGEITELPAAVSAHDRQLLAQTLGKPEPAATLSTTDPLATFVATLTRELYLHLAERQAVYPLADFPAWFPHDDRNLAHLLQAVQSLSPRKISNGGATNDGLPDGISLAHIVAGTDALSVTKIEDDNHGWEFRSNSIFSIYANCEDFTLNCKDIVIAEAQYGSNYYQGFLKGNTKVKRLNLPEFDGMKGRNGGTAYYCYIAANCSAIEEVLMPNMWRWTGENSATNTNNISQDPNLWRVVMGNITTDAGSVYYFYQCPKLIDLEFKGVQVSINLSNWNPSYVLSDNPTGTDLIEEGSTAQNNLDQFLQNFRSHIALRLTDNGSGKTLTLSQAVRDAIHAAESTYGIEDIIVNQKHWTLSPAPSA